MAENTFTVGDLRRHLAYLSDDTKLSFGGVLTFYRVKDWGENEAYIEFNEPLADLSPDFRKRNPHILVAYVNTDTTQWDEEGRVGSINVSTR